MTTDQMEDHPAATTALADSGSPELTRDLSSSAFIAVARALSECARGLGLIVPAFRTPPRTPGLTRAVRRWPGGGATVSVRRTGVPAAEVLDSMVEGVLAAGRLPASTRERVRPILRQTAWAAAGLALMEPADTAPVETAPAEDAPTTATPPPTTRQLRAFTPPQAA